MKLTELANTQPSSPVGVSPELLAFSQRIASFPCLCIVADDHGNGYVGLVDTGIMLDHFIDELK